MSGCIGVDLDGTLAHYEGWGDGSIGKPIPAMLLRVLDWIVREREVRIVTARVARTRKRNNAGIEDGDAFADEQERLIRAWCLEHIGRELEVTATKDFGMIELWDDRAVQVIANTGKRADGK